MNDRIRELMIEAGIYECDDFEPHPTFEKFAELIVRECADMFSDDLSSMRDYTGKACRYMIKQHFGIKE